TKQVDTIIMWGIIMLIISLVAFAAGILNSYYSSHISNLTGYDIREKLFSTIQNFSYDILNMYPASMIVTRFTNDVRQVQNTLFMRLRIMVKAPLLVIGSVIMAFIVNVKLSLIFLLIVPLLVLFLYWVLIRGSRMFSKVQSRIDMVNRV